MARCPVCQQDSLPAESRFCFRCGADVGEATADRAAAYTPRHLEAVLIRPATREGERKDVTVLVADVAGSLAVAERLDPEDVHVLMDGFFALALDAVHAERGTLNQFRGDGFMALFGAPVAVEDHVVHAARAALAIRRASQDYNRSVRVRFGVPFVVRIGMHCGPVWVGSIGTDLRRDYTAEGPTVGIAARIEQIASPGQILVSGAFADRVGPYAEVVSAGVRTLRGVSEPVATFELVRAGPHETRLDVERARGLRPLVGRDAELLALGERLAAAGSGALWLELVGEAGVGKSRLAHELRTRHGGTWLEGRCREPETTRAFSTWLDVLRRWPSERVEQDGVGAVIAAFAGDPAPRSPRDLEERLRALLDRAAAAGPIRIHLEDVQWMDRASRSLAESLLADPPATGIRFLATARSDGSAPPPHTGRSERVLIAPLSPTACEAIARETLGDDPETRDLAALAALQSGGNALFVVELARTLAEGNAPLRNAAHHELGLRRSVVRVPTTLRDVLAARIDALPDRSKTILQSASVIGRPFTREQLAAIDEGADALGTLVERGLLVAVGAEIDFQHGLLREVAYEQMLRGRRQELHRAQAAWLAGDGRATTPEGAAEIGWHCDLAGDAARAVRSMVQAGRGFLALFAARESAAQLGRAWELLASIGESERDAEEWHEVGLLLATALNTLDRSREAAAVLERLAAEGGSAGEAGRLAEACVESGWVAFGERGETARGLSLVERGIVLARESGQRRIEAQGHGYRIRICHLDARIDEAMESARRVAEMSTAAGERFGAIFGMGNEGHVQCDAGQIDRALALTREAHQLACEARNDVGRALTGGWLAKALVFCGDAEQAVQIAEEARALARSADQQGALYNAEAWSGAALLQLGQTRRGAECFERLAAINARWPTTLDWLALASLETGRFAEAAELARNALAQDPPRLVRARVLRSLGLALALARTPDFEQAEQAISDSLSIAVECKLVPHIASAHAALAELCARRGDSRRLRYYSERAQREWISCGMAVHAEQASRQLA